MARRPGKAASRKARQRYVPRAATRPAASPEASASVEPSVTSETAAPEAPRRPSAAAGTSSAVGSTLSVREKAEYHYVERDLRNIGILAALMVVLLLVAWAAFTALDLVG